MAVVEKQHRQGRSEKKVRARIRHAASTRIPVRLSRGRLVRLRSMRRLTVVDRRIVLPTLPDAHLIERFRNAGLNLLVNECIALEYRGNRSSENTERGSTI